MIANTTVSGTYKGMLEDTLKNGYSFMQVAKVIYPISGFRINIEPHFNDKLQNFRFPDGKTGIDWLQGRIDAMFEENGEYWKPMRKDGQFDYILDSLQNMRNRGPRWNANRLIITLFDSEKDLHKSRMPTPPCLVMLSFHPEKKDLSMAATFRAQYTDAKGYGNLYSLAMLLQQVCEKTEFNPKYLYSLAQKAILKYPKKIARQFRYSLLKETKE